MLVIKKLIIKTKIISRTIRMLISYKPDKYTNKNHLKITIFTRIIKYMCYEK